SGKHPPIPCSTGAATRRREPSSNRSARPGRSPGWCPWCHSTGKTCKSPLRQHGCVGDDLAVTLTFVAAGAWLLYFARSRRGERALRGQFWFHRPLVGRGDEEAFVRRGTRKSAAFAWLSFLHAAL